MGLNKKLLLTPLIGYYVEDVEMQKKKYDRRMSSIYNEEFVYFFLLRLRLYHLS